MKKSTFVPPDEWSIWIRQDDPRWEIAVSRFSRENRGKGLAIPDTYRSAHQNNRLGWYFPPHWFNDSKPSDNTLPEREAPKATPAEKERVERMAAELHKIFHPPPVPGETVVERNRKALQQRLTELGIDPAELDKLKDASPRGGSFEKL